MPPRFLGLPGCQASGNSPSKLQLLRAKSCEHGAGYTRVCTGLHAVDHLGRRVFFGGLERRHSHSTANRQGGTQICAVVEKPFALLGILRRLGPQALLPFLFLGEGSY